MQETLAAECPLTHREIMEESAESGVVVLEELGKPTGSGGAGMSFETAVGRNGKVWVQSEDVKAIVAVCRALRETDEGGLDVAAQKKLVKRIGREMR